MNNISLLNLLDQLLLPNSFRDYCPNGLQIQGKSECRKLLCAVSISEALINHAIENNYDAILVHHGIFWHKMPYNITGIQYNRISKLIKHDINLYAYHLPLDNHIEFGNNIQLAKLLNINVSGQTGEQNLLWFGNLITPQTLKEFKAFYYQITSHKPFSFGNDNKILNKIAWCTGAATNMFHHAIDLDVDCYITGEINEQIMSLSQESAVAYIAAGHYVTEKFGIQALSEYLKQYLDSQYLDLYNPI
jgi:dinuclear metal center YbgI/SA1388 family protein